MVVEQFTTTMLVYKTNFSKRHKSLICALTLSRAYNYIVHVMSRAIWGATIGITSSTFPGIGISRTRSLASVELILLEHFHQRALTVQDILTNSTAKVGLYFGDYYAPVILY
jgi:hypothetical protein